MNKSTIDLAKTIANDHYVNKLKIIDLCNKYGRKRAQITMFLYAATSLPDALLWYYLNKHVGLKPLVELHKQFGNCIVAVIHDLYKEKIACGDTSGLKKPQIIREMEKRSGMSTSPKLANSNNDLSTTDALESYNTNQFTDAALSDCRSSVSRIRNMLNEAAQYNQDPTSLRLKPQTYRKIIQELSILEQCFDDGDSSPEQQGDPTDYIFANMVDPLPNEQSVIDDYVVELDEIQYRYEDISQDPRDFIIGG